jgi:flap endonuclease-1
VNVLSNDITKARLLQQRAATSQLDALHTVRPYCCYMPQVTSEHNEECKKLLRLMGVPVIDAPSEAEAQCAAMAKAGVVYGAATEDMDCLTFGCPTLIRHLMAPASQNAAIQEFSLAVVLEVRLRQQSC